MSVVTNVILKTSLRDRIHIQALNAIFQSGQGFVSCDNPSLPRGWYAGGKMLECVIYPGSFNYLVLADLVYAIRQIEWRAPKALQLFIQEQEDDRFREILIDFPQ